MEDRSMADRTVAAWDGEAFIAAVKAVGGLRYHDKHPFHRQMNGGRLTREQVQGWVANRFTISAAFRSRMQPSCPTVRCGRCAAFGCRGSSCRTVLRTQKAASRLGCGWPKPSA